MDYNILFKDSPCEEEILEILEHLHRKQKLKVNRTDGGGQTLLSKCAVYHLSKVVKYLLKIDNIDVNIQDIGGWTALIYACYGHFDIEARDSIIADLLQVEGIQLNIQEQHKHCTALMYALDTSKTASVLKLLKMKGIDVNLKRKASWGGETPLIMAVIRRNVDAVKALLKFKNLDLQATKSGGATALIKAIDKYRGHKDDRSIEVLTCLLKDHRIDVDFQYMSGGYSIFDVKVKSAVYYTNLDERFGPITKKISYFNRITKTIMLSYEYSSHNGIELDTNDVVDEADELSALKNVFKTTEEGSSIMKYIVTEYLHDDGEFYKIEQKY